MTNADIDNADIDNDFDADAETDTKTETETLKGTRFSRSLVLALIALISLAPLALLALPGVQAVLTSLMNRTDSPDYLSYDPNGPVVVLRSSGAFLSLSDMAGGLGAMAIVGVVLLVHWGLQRLCADWIDRKSAAWAFLFIFVGVAGMVITMGAVKVGVVPDTDRAQAREAEPALVAQWAEERYGLDIDETTAESLVDEAKVEGDPVLIDGRLINLTRIAQGGYVLTDDKSATELPTKN